MLAEFECVNGDRVFVPSLIYPLKQQVALIESSGLKVRDIVHVQRSVLKATALSPKLLVGRGNDLKVVTGYLVVKRSIA